MSLSNITLSSSVRQNLLSLQDTANLLSTTQTRLATGKRSTARSTSPTNFFTASGLDARASDIGNLLDSIGNGVQVLQAANTGITSLSKLVDTAKSIANQALQQSSALQHQGQRSFRRRGVPARAQPLPRTSMPARSVVRSSRSRLLRVSPRRSPSVRRLSPSTPPPRRRRLSRWMTSTRLCRRLASM